MLRTLILTTVTCVVAVASNAVAQTVQPAAPYEYADYYEARLQVSPSDAPITSSPSDAPIPMAPTPTQWQSDSVGKSFGKSSPCDSWCEPVRYLPTIGNWSARGWANFGFTANDRSPISRFNGPLGLNDRDEFMGNQVYVVLENPVQTGCGWDVGGRVDILFGTDYVVAEQVGWEQTQTGAPRWNNRRFYGIATPQAYVEAANENISLKVGRFYSLVGYESVMAPENFFYSHSYAFTHGMPITHTGVLATADLTDSLVASAGVVNGWDRFDGLDDVYGFLGGFRYQPDCSPYTVSAMVVLDHERTPLGNHDNRWMYTMLVSYDYSDRTQFVLQHDAGNHNAALVGGGTAEWYGVAQYVYYTINPCWKAGARFEWFRDDAGTRVRGIRASNPYTGPSAGDFFDISLGLNWTPNANLVVRPEIRWDWHRGSGVGVIPYNGSNEQFTAAIDAIVHF